MLAARIASVRGAPIECFGSTSLARLDAAGRPYQLMQADNVVYAHPVRWQDRGRRVDVYADPLPDVVLEVDHTTDVRRWKLGKGRSAHPLPAATGRPPRARRFRAGPRRRSTAR